MGENKEINLEASKIPLVGTGFDAPVVYADDIRGTMVLPHTAKLGLVTYRVDSQTEEVRGVHVATLVIPTSQLVAWGEYMLNVARMAQEADQNRANEAAPDAKA